MELDSLRLGGDNVAMDLLDHCDELPDVFLNFFHLRSRWEILPLPRRGLAFQAVNLVLPYRLKRFRHPYSSTSACVKTEREYVKTEDDAPPCRPKPPHAVTPSLDRGDDPADLLGGCAATELHDQ